MSFAVSSVLLIVCVVSITPLAALAVLILAGAVAAGPALLAMVGVAAAGFGLALFWVRDLGRVAAALGGPASGLAGAPASAKAPLLPPLADLWRKTQSRLRGLAIQAARAEELWCTDETIIEALPDPLIIVGTDLQLRRANRAAVREFGSEAAAILRHPLLRAGLAHALVADAPQTTELVLPVPVPRELRAIICPFNQKSKGSDLMILLADRTRERAVERMRADFVANAGHELRTPLASLMGFIETLRGPAADDPAAQRRFLAIMAEQASRMHRLIDDLLSLSSVELVEHQRPTDLVDLGTLIERIAAGFEPAILAREATLALALEPALPPLAGDADQLAQVLQNLLDNALKYGGMGVHIRVAAEPACRDQRWPAEPGVVLAVSDNGPGIAREHLPRLTERFYRADKARSRAAGSTGLGLAIIKHIVNRHRGQLRVESSEGVGSTFSVWLPAARGHG